MSANQLIRKVSIWMEMRSTFALSIQHSVCCQKCRCTTGAENESGHFILVLTYTHTQQKSTVYEEFSQSACMCLSWSGVSHTPAVSTMEMRYSWFIYVQIAFLKHWTIVLRTDTIKDLTLQSLRQGLLMLFLNRRQKSLCSSKRQSI